MSVSKMDYTKLKAMNMGELVEELQKCETVKSAIISTYIKAAEMDLMYKAAKDVEKIIRMLIAIKINS